ncbi:MAG: methyltransferase domain-containing protein [Candidatus Krumholzibacteriia bacterium]
MPPSSDSVPPGRGDVPGHADVVDIRRPEEFRSGHLPGAWSRPLEAEPRWPRRGPCDARLVAELLPSVLLPARDRPLLVTASSFPAARAVASALAARGRAVSPVSLGPDALPRWRRLAVETGPGRARLWSPPPFLARWAHVLPPPAAGHVLDLAAGSGRAAVWLAGRGYRVTAVDRDPGALVLAGQLARLEGVDLTLREGDLRRAPALPAGPWAVVLLFRYLDRPLLRRLATVMAPGGLLVLRTFRDAPGHRGPPSARHRLRRLEIPALLAGDAWELLVHEEGFDPDGQAAAGAVARRRAPAVVT